MKLLLRIALPAAVCCAAMLGGDTGLGSFIVTNDDLGPPLPSTATFYSVNADGTLGKPQSVQIGGNGIGGGFFAAARVIVMPTGGDACVFLSDAQDGYIKGIDAATHSVSGPFYGSPTDAGTSNGIGLAVNAHYVYATFTDTTTIGTFSVQAGCSLSFVGDVFAAGLGGGVVGGMAVNGNTMIVTYGDGSVESFNISGGMPVSNGDQQYTPGSESDRLANGVVITRDGHFAIFGDSSTRTGVEVSDISSGKIGSTVAYDLGPAWNSGAVRLSPDDSVLYISNDSGGGVTAAFFNSSTGEIFPGCTSGALKGYYTKFAYTGAVRLQTATGTGGKVYVPEFGSNGKSFIAMLDLTQNGSTCTLTESATSPVGNPGNSSYLLSIAGYPAQP